MADGSDELRLMALEARVDELEHRLSALAAYVDELSAELALKGKPAPPTKQQAIPAGESLASAAVGVLATERLHAELRRVVDLLRDGDATQAQRELYGLPEEQLSEHSSIVALIAAALFIQRGDFGSAKKALQGALSVSNDRRLSRLLKLVEEYSG
jgi:hypothetical protein